MTMRTVVAEGYTRTVRVGKKMVSTVLPDLHFRVCDVCGHWNRSGARFPCTCHCHRGYVNA